MKNKSIQNSRDMEKEFKKITVITTNGIVSFTGKYRRDLEATNWHYYEDIDSNIHHFRKEYMVGVIEGESAKIQCEKLWNSPEFTA